MYGEILLVKAAFCCIAIITNCIIWGRVLHVNNDNNKKNNDNDNGSKNDGADGCKYGECVMIVIDYFGFIKGTLRDPASL